MKLLRLGGPLLLAASLPLLSACSRSQGPGSGKGAPAAPPVPVTVATATQREVPVQLRAIGSVRTCSKISIKSRVDGELVKVGFNEGDEVKQGDLLFTVDPATYQVALHEAEAAAARDAAQLQNAEADMRRTDELANSKAVSATTVDQNRAKVASLKATVAADQAAIERAKLQLSYCYIRAPITGRVGTLLVNEGNMVKNNDTILAVINQTKPIYVDFSVPEQSLAAVREHMAKKQLKVEAAVPGQERRAAGDLLLVNNEVDATTGTILLRAVFLNADEMLWPGQFVSVTLTLATQPDTVVVPSQAVQDAQQGQFVFVVKTDNTVEARPVVTGDQIGTDTVILKGLQAGDQVVTTGQLRLREGSTIQTKGPEEPAAKKS